MFLSIGGKGLMKKIKKRFLFCFLNPLLQVSSKLSIKLRGGFVRVNIMDVDHYVLIRTVHFSVHNISK